MNTSIDLGKASVPKIFWTYAIPSILAMVAQNTAAFVDTLFIGRYVGTEGLSAITLVMPILMLLMGIATMVAVGGTTQAGIELGKGNDEESNRFFNRTMILLAAIGVTAAGLVMAAMPLIADFTGAAGITRTYTEIYGRTLAMFVPFFLMNFAYSFFLKLDGKPVVGVAVLLGGTVINIFLDWLFVAKLGMSLRGAALATGLSQLLPWFVLTVLVFYQSRWRLARPGFNWVAVKKMLFNGVSELLSNTSVSIAGMVFNVIIMRQIGYEGVAAYAVALQIGSMASAIGYGFSESCQSAISYNFGAGKRERVDGFIRLVLKASLIAGVALFAIGQLFGEPLAGLFVDSPSTIALAGEILDYYSVAFIFLCSNIAFGTYYTAVDDPILSGGITLYRSLIALLIGLSILPALMGSIGIWMTVIFAEATTFGAGMILLKRVPYGLKALPQRT